MLLPRPEIRMATRFGSRIVRRGPILRGVPCSGSAGHRAAARTFFDPPYLKHLFVDFAETARNAVRLLSSDDHGHADAAIERPRHLLRSDPACLLEECEDGR